MGLDAVSEHLPKVLSLPRCVHAVPGERGNDPRELPRLLFPPPYIIVGLAAVTGLQTHLVLFQQRNR